MRKTFLMGAVLAWASLAAAESYAPTASPASAGAVPAASDGMVKKYYPSGEVMSAVSVWDGKLDGPAFDYYKNGQIMYEWNYLKDELHGTCRAYTMDGKKTAVWRYKQGKRHGKSVEFHRNGKKRLVEAYRLGVKKSRMTYDEKGKRLTKEAFTGTEAAVEPAPSPAAPEQAAPTEGAEEKGRVWEP